MKTRLDVTGNEADDDAAAAVERYGSPERLRSLDYGQLDRLAAQIREFLVSAVSRTGGHLGSNLGVVELTLAIHRVFDSPHDVVLWDTGHQAYVHKLVTGRADRFAGLRQAGGLSGYPRRAESPHDWIENSHASTVLSYAQGFADAFAYQREQRRVVAVIGDGSMTGGMAFEGLNNLGRSGRHVLVILNDNGRSYAPTASRLPERLRRTYAARLHAVHMDRLEKALHPSRPLDGRAAIDVHAMYQAVGDAPRPEAFFHALGLRYTGPVDGHSVPALEAALRSADAMSGPVVLHVVTRKGKGYGYAEDDEEKCLHDVSTFDPATGPVAAKPGPSGLTRAFSDALIACAADDNRIHAITAAMPGPTGLLPFQQRYPDRFHDVGIAEQHAVTMAAGMAMAGLRPVLAVYSTFFTRAMDQANLDVGMHRLPVVFALDRAGITGDDGPSHHGVLDMALALRIPGMTVLAPSSGEQLEQLLRYALTLPGPSLIRWPKGEPVAVPTPRGVPGRAQLVRSAGDRRDVCLLAVGRMLTAAAQAAQRLAEDGFGVSLWDVRSVKPLDEQMLEDAAGHTLVVTVEDGFRQGGAGTSIMHALTDRAARDGQAPPRVAPLGVPDEYLAHGKPDAILAELGLDAAGIDATVRRHLAAAGVPGHAATDAG